MRLFSTRDAATVTLLLRAAARAEVMPRFRKLDPGTVRTKSGPLDLVTAADEAAERVITDGLRRHFPGCLVVGEEAASADAAILEGLSEAELAFVVDPVDGTSNYAAGLPLFGTMAAAIARGEIVAAVIHDPVGDDTAIAVRGEGAWMEAADGTRHALRVAEPVAVDAMAGAASWRGLPEEIRDTVHRNLGHVAAAWDYRCAAHEYRMAAAGHCHFLLFGKLMPWDHAPGWLLHREAGGHSARLDGSDYRPSRRDGGLLCAPDRASWEALRAMLLTP
jgi:fructose-1,6-bisphosphatase/inositol monophosphatase family enzyme